MTAITGSDTIAILKQGTTYGTPVQGATGDKLILEGLTPSRSVTEGTSNAIGSGVSWKQSADVLGFEDSISFSQQARYDDRGLTRVLAGFFGASTSVPAENNVGEGDYFHRITHSGSADKFYTLAVKDSSATSLEWASCYPVSLSIESGATPGYLTYTANFIANNRNNTPSVNTVANLASATVAGTTKVIHNSQALDNESENYVWLNLQSDGALDSGDAICPSTISISFEKPRELIRCFGGSEIRRSDIGFGTVTMEFPKHADHTWLNGAKAGTVYKALWNLQGSQIEAGDDYSITFNFPELVIVEDPTPQFTEAGINSVTVVFQALSASASPTGMSSTEPYVDVVTTTSTTFLT